MDPCHSIAQNPFLNTIGGRSLRSILFQNIPAGNIADKHIHLNSIEQMQEEFFNSSQVIIKHDLQMLMANIYHYIEWKWKQMHAINLIRVKLLSRRKSQRL